MSLDLIGAAFINLDGKMVANISLTLDDVLANEPGDESGTFFPFVNLANVLHELVVEPQTNLTIIGFDHLIYTCVVEH
jgi:hypothetical protein